MVISPSGLNWTTPFKNHTPPMEDEPYRAFHRPSEIFKWIDILSRTCTPSVQHFGWICYRGCRKFIWKCPMNNLLTVNTPSVECLRWLFHRKCMNFKWRNPSYFVSIPLCSKFHCVWKCKYHAAIVSSKYLPRTWSNQTIFYTEK